MEKKQIAIVTGANGGLGKEFVKLLVGKKEITEIWAFVRNYTRALNVELQERGISATAVCTGCM